MKFSIVQKKNYVLGGYYSILTAVFIASKHLKVFDTSIFLETKVFPKYFKKVELPNGPLVSINFFSTEVFCKTNVFKLWITIL